MKGIKETTERGEEGEEQQVGEAAEAKRRTLRTATEGEEEEGPRREQSLSGPQCDEEPQSLQPPPLRTEP